MAPRRFPKRPRQIRTVTNVGESPPDIPQPLTKSPIDFTAIKMTPELARSPESVRFEAPEPLCIKELSPKIFPRAPKLKLNLDIPEEDPEDEVNHPKEDINILQRTISIDKVYDMGFLSDRVTPHHFVSFKEDKMASAQPQNEETTVVSIENTMNEEILDNFSIYHLPSVDSDLQRDFYASEATGTYSERLKRLKQPHEVNRLEDDDNIDESKSMKNLHPNLLISSSIFPSSSASIDENYEYFRSGERTPQSGKTSRPKIDERIDENLSNRRQQMAIVCQNNEFTSKSLIKSINSPIKSPDAGINSADKFFVSTFRSSPPAKSCRTTLKFDEVKISSEQRGKVGVNEVKCGIGGLEEIGASQEGLKISWEGSPMSGSSVEIPRVTESGCKTFSLTMEPSDPQVVVENHVETDIIEEGPSMRMRMIKCWGPVERMVEFIEWIGGKIIVLVKNGCRIVFRGFFYSNVMKKSPQGPQGELGQVVEAVRKDNERMVVEISERINCLSKELVQTCVTNKESLSALTKEVENLKTTNQQLLSSNDTLMRQLKTLSEALDSFKSSSRIPLASAVPTGASNPSIPPPPPPMPGLFGPPPPPPPPMPAFLLNTPKTSLTSMKKSPKRKCSTPLMESRPSITVEDLLKVTLKKAPQQQKDPRKTPLNVNKGPVVSMDMLRSVKLKSTRRRSTDSTRSPRRVHPYKNRNTQSLTTLSPISAREGSPLHRILRQVDDTRRGFRRKIMSPTQSSQSDHETSHEGREIDARCNRSHSVIT